VRPLEGVDEEVVVIDEIGVVVMVVVVCSWKGVREGE
jgi:hypothetical protein